ncbi:glycosyltransferase [Enterococcus sp. GMD5E]|uniref:glycosyltransferase n=1 Tax=Enterococcus TaxID=1350 RepID=UPI000280E08D|nr:MULTISPECIES: glycosyltransferase [Enterococcus]EKQ76791.1 glycosyltransferase [Enterococcus sp. GMD5E]EKA15884.1 glycosyltransferase [Enterococcus sp. GMD1E]MDQ8562388.1 glycosyltransferase [Enterococcus faecium]OFM89562.1 glycosyltransferase [Enterococcus sp. HMSC069A01]HAR1668328.1 glycosyltransferase family 4 protein [Enterococcus faecium]
MRIVVNDIAASEGGAMSVLKDFYEEVKEFGADHEWIFLLGDYYLEETPNIKVYVYPEIKKSWLKRLNFDFYFGKNIVNEFKPDIYLSLQNTATLGIRCQQVVYLHQPLPYQKEKRYSLLKKQEVKYAVYQKLIGRIINFLFKKTKAKIIVQSVWMKKSIEQKISNQVKVIVPKINNDLMNMTSFSEEKYKTQNVKKFFYPASYYPYKNHEILFRAVEELLKDNINNFTVYLTLNKDLFKNGTIPANIKFLGNLDRKKVFELYAQSVLLFPSYIETFGLPLLEAKIVQSPIIVAQTEFSNEILSDYKNTLYFNKEDYHELKEKMKLFITNDFTVEKLALPKDDFNNLSIFNYLAEEENF